MSIDRIRVASSDWCPSRREVSMNSIDFRALVMTHRYNQIPPWRHNESNFSPVSGGDDYTEWLPSLNVTFDFGENNLLRFAYAKTLARARY